MKKKRNAVSLVPVMPNHKLITHRIRCRLRDQMPRSVKQRKREVALLVNLACKIAFRVKERRRRGLGEALDTAKCGVLDDDW